MKRRFLKKDLDFYREKLLNMKDDILKQMRDVMEDTLMKSQKDTAGYTMQLADVATDSYDRDFNLSLVSNERNIVLSIDEALKRIEDKSYGMCSMCQKAVSKTRLKAIPYARYCKKCKEKLEKNENK